MDQYSYEINYYTISNQLVFEIKSTKKQVIVDFVNQLISLYAHENESNGLTIDSYQIHTVEHLARIDEILEKYKESIPPVNGIVAFFRKIEIGEAFAFIPGVKLNQSDKIELRSYLESKGNLKIFEEKKEQFDELFGELLSDYTLSTFGWVRSVIGENDKALRKCRFCGEGQPLVSFRSKAHAISEGLGNKKVILNEECDQCNDKFSEGIEPDLIEYLALFRTMYGVQAKGGEKKYIGSNFELLRKDGSIHLISKEENSIDFENKKENKISLKSYGKISLQDVYRCLCKYFISVINSEKLEYFQKTIDWINGDFDINDLPKVAHLTSYHAFTLEPKLICYLRTADDKSIPYAVCELRFTCRIIVFIIPMSSRDSTDFVQKSQYDKFWEKFKHYNSSGGWEFHDLSQVKKRNFVFNLNIINNGFSENKMEN